MLPLRVYLFADGVHVVRSDSANSDLLGARIETIGVYPVDAAIARLRPWVHADNESAFRDIVASRLMLGELLKLAGIAATSDSINIRARAQDGALIERVLRASDPAAPLSSRRAVAQNAPTPLSLRNTDQPFSFADVDSLHVFWIQFNAVQDGASESLAELARRALAEAERSDATRLVIDVRRNNGGDNTLLRPLLVGLIRSRFNAPGHLYIITGRLTFSAAVNFVTRAEAYTDARFVGEPTGAPPNHFGETARLILPHSGLTVLYSTLWWQDADPRDTRPWIAPTIIVPPTFADYRVGRDTALDAILRDPPE
ncbi:MAG: hypothetical protein ABI910_07565 [Gemmatimonadota bacterium]